MGTARRARREPAVVLAAWVVAGGIALSAGGPAWATATVTRRSPLPPVTETFSGTDLAPLVPACGLLLLAAAVAVVAVRGVVRRLVGLLGVAGGATLLWSGVRALVAEPGLADLSGAAAADATAIDVSRSAAWPVLTVLAGVLAVAAGVLAVARGAGWAGMGRRYERAAGATPAAADAAGSREDRALDAWRALDRGEDPTADDGQNGGGPAGSAGERGRP